MKRFEKVLETKAWVLSPEHLFIEKLKWIQRTESDFHLRDLNNLLFFPGLDKSAISMWCRKLNLNTSVETFVTFKASSGIIISMGPQFRYQLLSSYKSNYNYAEKRIIFIYLRYKYRLLYLPMRCTNKKT